MLKTCGAWGGGGGGSKNKHFITSEVAWPTVCSVSISCYFIT